MANFDQLKQSVAALIRTNGAEEITGAIMQDVLLTIINSIAGGYMFGGVAQHSGNVGNPDYNVFYLAGSGSYTGYGGAITIENGCYGVFRYNGVWTQEVVDIGVRLSGSIVPGETRGVTGDVINTALQTLFDNVMNILDTLTFTYNTPSAQQATKAMLDVIVTPTGGSAHILTTLTLASATVAAAGLMSAEDKQKLDRMLTDLRSLSLDDTTQVADQASKIALTLSATLGENPEAITTMTFLAATASKAGLMSAADKAMLDCLVAMLGYYECSTAAGTAAKTVSASGYSLTNGGCIRVKMNNANTADNVTLNINGTGAKALYYDGAQASSSNSWDAGDILEVFYDGTQYQCASGGGGGRAEKVEYDNTESGMTSTNVQEAIDELSNELKCFIQQSNFTSEVKKKGQTRTHITPELIAGKTYRFHVVLSSPATGDITPILYVNNNTSDNTYIGLANGRITSGQSEITFDYTPSSGTNYQYLGWWSVNDVRTATVTISEGTLLSDKVEELAVETDNMNEAIFSKSDSFNQSIPARSQIRHLFPTELVVGVKYHFILDFTTTTTNKVTIYLYVNETTEVTDYVKIAEVPSGSTHYEFDYTPQTGSNYQYFGAFNEGVATAVIVEYSWISDESKLTDIEGKIDELYENVFIKDEHYTAGACFRDRNFNLTADENYGYTDFWIEVTPGTTILWNQTVRADSYMVIATANMSYSDRWAYTGVLRQISIKSTEKYIRVSFPLSDKKNTWVKDSLGNIIWQPVTYETSEQAIEELRDDMDSSISSLKEEMRKEKKKKLLLASFVNADIGNGGLFPENAQYAPKRCWTGYLCLPERTTRIYCKVPDEFQFGIITFTDEPGAGASATSGWLNPSEGLYYDIPDGKFYFAIGLKKKDDTNFNASYVNELVESGDIEFTYDAVDWSDVYGRNSEQETIARSAMLGTTLATLKSYPKILHISDTHGDGVRFENAMKIADYLDVDAVAFTGDAVANGSRNMAYYIQYLGNKHKTPIFFCLGNHELSGDMPSNTYFIDPLKEKYGYMKTSDTVTDTNYYYHDIASKNIRLIALDQFCGHYGSQNKAGKIGQEQITWLCNTLADTPANYGVVILMHAPEDVVPKDNTYDKFWQSHGYCQNGMYEAEERPIEKIIDAFISKSTLNLTYTNAQNESVTINADFTSLASGVEFIAYINGHKHVDQVGYLENATNLQLNLLVTCGIAYYGTTYQGLANFNDCPREPLGQTQDAVSLYVIDRTNGVVKVVRLGAYMRADMTKKDYMAIPYRDANG